MSLNDLEIYALGVARDLMDKFPDDERATLMKGIYARMLWLQEGGRPDLHVILDANVQPIIEDDHEEALFLVGKP